MVELQNGAIRPLFERRPLRDIEELAELAPWFRDWCDHDDPEDAYWRRISAADHVEDITLPVLHLTGWYDLFTKGGLAAFSTLQGRGRGRPAARRRSLEPHGRAEPPRRGA